MFIGIIGGGIVGLNIALLLAERRPTDDIYLFEQEPYLGHHTSSRNSEVIHAGFAYPPNSLKTTLCIEGNHLTYELLDRLKVPYKKCGKWVVATNDIETKALEAAILNATNCHVPGIERKTVGEFLGAESSAYHVQSLFFSATSGLMDVSSYIRALETKLATFSNVQLIYPCRVDAIDQAKALLATSRGEIPFDLLINSAGLEADDVYRLAGGQKNYQILPFKGEYYSWPTGTVRTMIYPTPLRFLNESDKALVSSMGIHTHRNVAGELLVGPSQKKGDAGKKYDYSFETSADYFAQNLSKFIQDVNPSELRQAYVGNRPKLFLDSEPLGDFTIFREKNVIHLLGIESPGLTAAPAIAKYLLTLI